MKIKGYASKLITIVFIIQSVINSTVFSQNILSRDSIIAVYNRMTAPLIEKFLCCDTLRNSSGRYSWYVSYILNADLLMYRATNDQQYLLRFIRVAGKVLSNRDDKIGLYDWQQKLGEGWSESQVWNPKKHKNAPSKPVRDLVNDAIICRPLLDFALIVKKEALHSLDSLANYYATESEKTIIYHIKDSWSPLRGVFYFPKGSPWWLDGANVPMNYVAQTGSDMIFLYKLTGKLYYIEFAKILADSLKKDMSIVDSCYIWRYWGGQGDRGWIEKDSVSINTPCFIGGHKAVEDIGHAGIDIEFIIDCYENDILFAKQDINMIINTYTKEIDKGTYNAYNLSGSLKDDTKIIPSYKWLRLTQYEPSILASFYTKYLHTAIINDGFGNAFLLANMVYYYHLLDMK
jgi:hypothetical protein